jgi:hypothetical protein
MGGALRRELGVWAGVVAEKSGDVRTSRSMTSVEGAELTGRVHDTERGERGVRGNGSATGGPGLRDRETGPLGSERGREGVREGELPLTSGVRLSDGAGARPGWAD